MRRSLVAALGLVSAIACAAGAQRGGGDWVQLGQRNVTDRVDHDAMRVTATEGRFSSIRLAVRRAAVDFHRVEIHFRNGGTQKVELRNTIPSGGESRVIDLEGDDRVIQSVEFWYDARTVRGRRASVLLFGRRQDR